MLAQVSKSCERIEHTKQQQQQQQSTAQASSGGIEHGHEVMVPCSQGLHSIGLLETGASQANEPELPRVAEMTRNTNPPVHRPPSTVVLLLDWLLPP